MLLLQERDLLFVHQVVQLRDMNQLFLCCGKRFVFIEVLVQQICCRALVTLDLRVLSDLRKGSKCFVGCGLAVFLLRVMCAVFAWLLFLLTWVFLERFRWKGFIFMVFGWASLLEIQSFMYPRRVDRSVVPLVELWSLWFLVLPFGGWGSSDKSVWVQNWKLPGGGFGQQR